MIHQFNTLQEIIDFVLNMDASQLKQMGLTLVKTNGETIVPISHEQLSPELQTKLADLETKLGLKVQINKDVFDETHPYKVLVKDTTNSHVYVIDPVITKNELDTIKDNISRKVQITGEKADIDDTYQVLAKNTADGHVYLCPVTVSLREKQELALKANQAYQHASEAAEKAKAIQAQFEEIKRVVELLGGSVPSSVMDEIQKLSAMPNRIGLQENALVELGKVVANLRNDMADFIRLGSGEASGNYKFVVQQPDGQIKVTDDWDYQVLQTIQNREINNGDLITWLMSRPVCLGLIEGTHAADFSLAPNERFSKHPLIVNDWITLKYPRGVSEPNKFYLQDFAWTGSSWQPKHI